MLATLLPGEVVVVETGELAGDEELAAVEAAQVAGAVPERRRELATGRRCARRALALLGMPEVPIPSGPDREPVWPPAVVGSITHCPGYYASAVARRDEIGGVGIDAELNRPLPEGVAALTSLDRESAGLPDAAGVSWPTVLFSARESVFKVWFPITRRSLEHHDVELVLAEGRGRFAVRSTASGAHADADLLARIEGRFAWSGSHVVTCAWLPGATGDSHAADAGHAGHGDPPSLSSGRARNQPSREVGRRTATLPGGGVRVPGGLPRLQSGWHG